jgi:arsenite-transporting ATPase
LSHLLDKQLVFLTGKGGVGKTTVCAALARLAVQRGKRVLLCEIDTEAYMGRLFGDAKIGFDPSLVAPGIWACTLQGSQCMDAFIRRFVPGRVADVILKNKVANIFFESAPSVMEAVIFDQIGTLMEKSKPAFDLVIVDLPASGHAVTLLNVPRSMVEMVRVGELAAHMERLAKIVADPERSELVLVSLPEEMSVNETLELLQKARARVQTPVRRIVLNGIRNASMEPDDAEQLERWAATLTNPDDAEAVQRLAYGARIGAFWAAQDAEAQLRLRAEKSVQVAAIPYIFDRQDDVDLVRRVAGHLGASLGVA